MTIIENIGQKRSPVRHGGSLRERGALRRGARARRVRHPRRLGCRRRHRRGGSNPSASSAEGVGPDGTQLSDERESLLVGFRQHARRPDPAPRPRRRQADAGTARPPARTGRHRDQVPRAGAGHRPLAEPHRPARRLRDHARRSRRRLPQRDRQHVAAPARIAHQPDRQADLGSHRRPRLPARPQGPQDHGAPAQGTLVAITGGKDIADPAAVIAAWIWPAPNTPT